MDLNKEFCFNVGDIHNELQITNLMQFSENFDIKYMETIPKLRSIWAVRTLQGHFLQTQIVILQQILFRKI